MTDSDRARGWHLAVLVVVLSPVFVFALAVVAERPDAPPGLRALCDFLTFCHVRAAGGTPCPTCGLTSCAVAWWHGTPPPRAPITPFVLFAALGVTQVGYRVARLLRPRCSFGEELAALGAGLALAALAAIPLVGGAW